MVVVISLLVGIAVGVLVKGYLDSNKGKAEVAQVNSDVAAVKADVTVAATAVTAADRKSTRLNSSH